MPEGLLKDTWIAENPEMSSVTLAVAVTGCEPVEVSMNVGEKVKVENWGGDISDGAEVRSTLVGKPMDCRSAGCSVLVLPAASRSVGPESVQVPA